MRKIVPLFAIAALSAAALGAAAYAAPSGAFRHPGPEAPVSRAEAQARADQFFAKLDANGDGVIDQKDRAARQAERFARLDTDHNGSLSPQEFAAAGKPMSLDEKAPGFAGPRHGGRGLDRPRFAPGKEVSLSKAEFEARTLARFDAADTNHDGTLSGAERKAAMTAHRNDPRATARAHREDTNADQSGQ